MLVYNVTSKIGHDISSSWLEWMRNEHIPDLVATGCFTHAVVFHLMELDDEDGVTYAVQFHTESKADYNRYISKYAHDMRQKTFDKWGEKIVSFRTLMQIVN